MKTKFLRIVVAMMAVAFILEAPFAYAIFGARVARRAIGAHRAKKAISSPTDDKAGVPKEAGADAKTVPEDGTTRQ